MSNEPVGKVLSIAVRTAKRGPMREIDSARAAVDAGIAGDIEVSPSRGITFLASGHWKETMRELGADLPWHTRRANVLIDAPKLGHLIGRTIRVGGVEVEILSETRPCGLMDELHMGLRQALTPDHRAGVLGRVCRDGAFSVGDLLEIVGTR